MEERSRSSGFALLRFLAGIVGAGMIMPDQSLSRGAYRSIPHKRGPGGGRRSSVNTKRRHHRHWKARRNGR